MPKLMDDTMEMHQIPGAGSFQFSAVKLDQLGATEYTLVTIVNDYSGSVSDFADALDKMRESVIVGCKKNPRAENVLLRDVTFNSQLYETHGFKPLPDIDPAQYPKAKPYGSTALFDAVYSAVGATLKYAEDLLNQHYSVNAVLYIVTDGENNASTMTPSEIKKKIQAAKKNEDIDSILTVLVGITNDAGTNQYFERFVKQAGIDQYINMRDVTPRKLAKLGELVSQSISSTSQNINTGQSSPISQTVI